MGPPPVAPGPPAAALAAPPAPPPVLPAAPAPVLPTAPPPDSQAAKLVAPVRGKATADDQPEEMTPQAARKRPVAIVKAPPTRRLQPGDLICGECGEGNAPTRKFCSRCGSSLEDAQKVKTPWWRKLFPKRKRKAHEIGDRPGRGGVKSKRLSLAPIMKMGRRVVAVIALVSGTIYAVHPGFRGYVNRQAVGAKDRVMSLINPRPEPVRPINSSANGNNAGHTPNMAIDGHGNTFWSIRNRDNFTPTIKISFSGKVDLDYILFTTTPADRFTSFDRIKTVHMVYSNGQSQDLLLKDNPDPQQYDLKNAHGINFVEIRVSSVHDAVVNSGNTTGIADVTLAEVEFFVKK